MKLLLMTLLGVLSGTMATAGDVQASIFFSIPSDYEKINSPPSEIVVINPYSKIEGNKINGVNYSINGSWYSYSCSSKDRNADPKTCGKPITIQPGPHIFYVVMCEGANCTTFEGDAWQFDFKLSVGIRERVTIDLAKLAAIGPKGPKFKAVSRKKLKGEKRSACVAQVEKAFYINTCRASGMGKLRKQLGKVHKVCSKTWSDNTDLLVKLAVWQTAWLHPKRCYTAKEIENLPGFLMDWYVPSGFWPPGTIKGNGSSWSWARDDGDEDLFAKYSGEKFRKRVDRKLKRWQRRQQIVDQLIQSALKPKTVLPKVIAMAKKSKKFDMNPTNPRGHRNFGLVTMYPDNPEVSELAASAIAKGDGQSGSAKIHCALQPEIRRVINTFLDDDKLTPTEWQASIKMLQSTPSDEHNSECKKIGFPDLESSIPLLTRLSTIAKYDCQKSREKRTRGSTINYLLDATFFDPPIPDQTRIAVMKKFSDCITLERQFKSAKSAESSYKDYNVKRDYYVTGDLRELNLEKKKSPGNYARIRYFVNGAISDTYCWPTSDNCQADYTGIDLKQAAKLTK